MIDFLLAALRSSPEIAVFLAIALGMLLGRVRLGSFHLGSVAGALLMGLLIGQIGLEVPQALKSVFFVLFIYAVGFKSGPEFFGSLNAGTLKLVLFSAVLCLVALGSILLMNLVFHFDAGFTAGLGAGALTDTAIMGTASSAIAHLPLAEADKAQHHRPLAAAGRPARSGPCAGGGAGDRQPGRRVEHSLHAHRCPRPSPAGRQAGRLEHCRDRTPAPLVERGTGGARRSGARTRPGPGTAGR